MFIAMNRFKVKKGSEEAFENIWKGRNSTLHEMAGFKTFHLLRGPENEAEGYTLFASHTVWASKEDFTAWTKSENFRAAHRNAGSNDVALSRPPAVRGLFGRRRRVKFSPRRPAGWHCRRRPSCRRRPTRSCA